jgi:ABC-type multidrug transport system fused ATPase/permease subunit
VVRDHAGALASAAAATILVTAAELAVPWPLKWVIDGIFEGRDGGFALTARDYRLLAVVAAAVVGIALLGAIGTYIGDVLLNRGGERIAHDLRVRTYAHLQRLSLAFHDRRQKGDLVTHLTDDANRVGEAFSDSLGAVAQAGLMVLGMTVLSLLLDPVLGLALVAVVPVLAVITLHYRRRVHAAARRQRDRDGEIASLAAESLSAMRLVQAYGTETREHDRVREHSERRRQYGIEAAALEARFAGLVDIVGAIAVAIVLVLGTFRVASGAITPGAIVVFAQYGRRLYRPLKDMAKNTTRISRAMARAERIAEVLAADDMLEERAGAHAGGRARGRIDLEGVSFGYEPGRTALDHLSLAVPAGSRIAIVGASGAGKSTVGALITRFYDPEIGRVLLDGRDLRDCSLRWVREQVGILLQDTVLLTGTIRDNIVYGTDASSEQVLAAARAVDADSFIRELPDGYDTQLGPQGVGLSGGQRQRLGIARVLLRDPPVLLLDEPTTGLDATSEAAVMHGLETLMSGRTTILITHSMALASRADRVVVLRDGRMAQDASPAELLAQPGLFRRLAREQGLLSRAEEGA